MMDDDFLLRTPLARQLYHECAESLPIIDYHNHLNIRELAENKPYPDLAALWLLHDPYKHRAMRICGISEKYITGPASNREKFSAWMETLPKLIGNPLYDWSILEMKRIFGLELIPGVTDTGWLWEQTGKLLACPEFTPLKILSRFGVEYAAPCAAITDDLNAFRELKMLAPSLRCDSLIPLSEKTVRQLEAVTGRRAASWEEFTEILKIRLDAFAAAGCRFADHALDDGFRYFREDGQTAGRFQALRDGALTAGEEQARLSCAILRILASGYAERGFTMQLHIGAQRFTSSRLRKAAGPAGGFAAIGNTCDVKSLTQMLDDFETAGMPRIMLFTLNPADNAVISTLSGSYCRDGVPGTVQQGPAWWWCDHLYGMREVFENLSAFGVLSVFPGMTTDSRSILSFVRHEYFRRALCGWIGQKAETGEFPASFELLKPIVEGICYCNIKRRIT